MVIEESNACTQYLSLEQVSFNINPLRKIYTKVIFDKISALFN